MNIQDICTITKISAGEVKLNMGALCTHLSEFCLPPLKSFRGIDSSTRRTFLLTLENGQRVILKQKRELKTCLREYELLKWLNDMNIPCVVLI